jgi:DHA2 family multidrug resistance protein-like MFS transporter
VVGLLQSGPWGWASADTLVLLAGGGVLLVIGLREAAWDAALLVVAGCLAAAVLMMPQYLELVRGLSPLRSGVLTSVITLSAATLAALTWLLAARVHRTLPLVGGLGCAALGALGMTRIDPASSYALVIVSSGLLGSGIGAAGGALAGRSAGAVAARTDPVRVAAAAATGAALLVATAGALLQRAQLEEREGGGSFEDALAAGLAASGWLMAALLAVAAVLVWRRADGHRGR